MFDCVLNMPLHGIYPFPLQTSIHNEQATRKTTNFWEESIAFFAVSLGNFPHKNHYLLEYLILVI